MIDSHCHLDHEPMYSDLKNVIQRSIKNRNGKKITVEVDNINQLKKIMRLIPRIASVNDFETNRFASADNVMTSGVQYVDDIDDDLLRFIIQ